MRAPPYEQIAPTEFALFRLMVAAA